MTTTNYSIGNLTSTPVSRSTFLDNFYTDDVYSFSTNATTSINLNLHNISIGDDADLYLYRDSNGNGVWDSGDQQLASSRRTSNNDDSINYQTGAGTYFARVERYAPGSNGRLDYALDLSATQTNPTPATTAPPNLIPNEFDGGVLRQGGVFTRSDRVGNSDTSDIYRLSLDRASNVNVSLTGLSSDADVRLISDLNNNHIVDDGEVQSFGFSNRGGTADDSFSFFAHSGNPFYIQVYQYSGDTNYQLQASASSAI
ncbi:MAG: PPC domain-containing protein [Iphinoe sp. HA4291-MV1]|jgi:hypothetical protein|nr:PPC domain-containing protein [Iphinoe sp. HA4291-MV1]